MLRKHPVFWSVVLATIPLLGWWTYGLFDLDEGFYGAVAVEMNRRGEWITPFYNGQPWFEKPILLYWLAKPCIALFGTWFGARLPSILATVATYSLTGWFAKRNYGTLAGVISVLALGSSLLFIGVGRMMLTDPLLDLCMAAAYFTFWESINGQPKWRLATAAALGFGVLAKGPIAGILFIPAAAWIYYRFPEKRPAFKSFWGLGTLLFTAIVATWYLPAYLTDGHMFVQKFLIEQNIGRFTGGDEAHTVHDPIQRLVFYIPIFLVGFAPWSVLVLLSRRKRAGDPLREDPGSNYPRNLPDKQGTIDPALNSYLWACMLTVFLFFTATSAKLVHYILPMGPPLAVLVGAYIAETRAQKSLRPTIAWLLTVAVIAEAAFYAYYHGLHLGPINSPGFHEEVQSLALYVHDHASPTDDVVEYRMGRQKDALPKSPVDIQETSHPSTVMILNRTVTNLETWPDILKLNHPAWIITRWNRITSEEKQQAGPRLQQVQTPTKQDLYRLYLWSPNR